MRSQTDSQSEQTRALPLFIAGLLQPEALPHPAPNLELRETHISWIILAGEYAYKLKKPVNFGFLDFCTLDRRRTDCEEEVRLNRRLCPDMYLGVVDVVERNGHYFVGGAGRVVEPAVWMYRLPDNGMLVSRLAQGAADGRSWCALRNTWLPSMKPRLQAQVWTNTAVWPRFAPTGTRIFNKPPVSWDEHSPKPSETRSKRTWLTSWQPTKACSKSA